MAEHPEKFATQTIHRKRDHVIRVGLRTHKGARLVEVRMWQSDKDGKLWPTSYGVNFSPAHLKAIKCAFDEMEAEAKAEGSIL